MLLLYIIRLLIGGAFTLTGLVTVVLSIIGVYRFNYVLNRMHVAASCDTLGLLMMTIGLIILNGWDISGLKLLLILIFFWIANPVTGHLISKLEVDTNENIEEECEVIER